MNLAENWHVWQGMLAACISIQNLLNAHLLREKKIGLAIRGLVVVIGEGPGAKGSIVPTSRVS